MQADPDLPERSLAEHMANFVSFLDVGDFLESLEVFEREKLLRPLLGGADRSMRRPLVTLYQGLEFGGLADPLHRGFRG